MNVEQIESNLKDLARNFSEEEFVFDLLLAYGTPKATVTLLKKGKHNLSKQEDQIILKKKLFFQQVQDKDLHETIDSLQNDTSTMRHSPRFIVVTDYKTLLAVDTKTKEQLDIKVKNIAKYYDFFLPWAGIEKHKHKNENPADRKAAERMAKLYDGILAENSISDAKRTHDLNIFLSRLLFCFFAEDTNIFEDGIFTSSIASHTQKDGSDLHDYLGRLFDVLNTKNTSSYPAHFQKFPYVNGGLFKDKHWIPTFSAKSRKIIIECGELNWAKINPDIFGSMIQAVVHPGQRGALGMHYTSVPNIMKVIEPLFLNELTEEFEKSKDSPKKLLTLLARIRKIKFFDPACGSGNFLIITYKEMRRLEMRILKALHSSAYFKSNLSKFYGIEIDDFAYEIAKLSLYLAEHQMNLGFKKEFGKVNPTLPLGESGNILCANATRVDWERVCPKDEDEEIYVFGNPPYLGSRKQKKEQKDDIQYVFKGFKKSKSLDYITCWFYLGARYIQNSSARLAFVSTNSICQGLHVSLIWPLIFNEGVKIHFARTSFPWKNNAKGVAGVTVIIVGLISKLQKVNVKLFTDSFIENVSELSGYLIPGKSNIFVLPRTNQISGLPKINHGNMPADGGRLLFSTEEKNRLIAQEPSIKKWFRQILSAKEYINGRERWCLWLEGIKKHEIEAMPLLKDIVEEVKKVRLRSSRPELAKNPHLFAQITQPKSKECIIVPRVSSQRRRYLPIGFIHSEKLKVTDSLFTVATSEHFVFSLISSRMHTVWLASIGGKMKTDYQYSKSIVYNTFPVPKLTQKQKGGLTRHMYEILDAREAHPEKTMSELYDPDKMPDDLKEAHHQLDIAVERLYRSKPFESDERRLEYLFKLYQQMIKDEEVQQSLV